MRRRGKPTSLKDRTSSAAAIGFTCSILPTRAAAVRATTSLALPALARCSAPWERYPGNPILAGNAQWKCPGHGSIVSDSSGRTFLLYHAYDASTFEFVGRQALLDEVTWDAQGWPAINGGRGPSASAALPSASAQRRTDDSIEDDFTAAALNPGWQWPWDQTPPPTIDRSTGGWLRLDSGPIATVVAARPTRSGSYVATDHR